MVGCPKCKAMAFEMSGYYRCSACRYRFHRCPRCGALGVFVECPVCDARARGPAADRGVREVAGELAAYLPLFEQPGYRFGAHAGAGGHASLSEEVTRFVALSNELEAMIVRRAEVDPRVRRALLDFRSMAFGSEQAREAVIAAAADVEGLCHLLYVERHGMEKWAGRDALLSWFESPGFLVLLRRIRDRLTAAAAPDPPPAAGG